MAEPIHLRNAPITEALLDFRVSPLASDDFGRLEDFGTELADRFPSRKERVSMSAQFRVQKGMPTMRSESHNVDGLLFLNHDDTEVVQARLNGFAFSRLAPYTEWATVSGSARSLWATYVKHVRPRRVVRLATRYINRIEVGAGSEVYESFRFRPEIPTTMPDSILEYLMRVVIEVPEHDARAVLTQAIDMSNDWAPNKVPIIFDIDVFQTVDLPVDSEELWERMEVLRKVKNKFFFESITNELFETYK